jgi:hypothetical protein
MKHCHRAQHIFSHQSFMVMKTLLKTFALASILLVGYLGCTNAAGLQVEWKIPDGWIRAGSKPQEYDMGLDRQTARTGKASLMIRLKTKVDSGFGTVMQMMSPSNYFNKRIRLSGYIKTVDAAKASLWLRVDGPERMKSLAFDNMDSRYIRGTEDWKKCEIVLDVAPEATNIAFGAMLIGKGQMWSDDLKLEVVGKDVPVTDMELNRKSPTEPQNLDFEK